MIRLSVSAISYNTYIIMRKNYWCISIVTLLAASSCVHQEYDLSKPFDNSVNVGGHLELPLPMDTGNWSYTLGELLNLDGNTSVREDEDGTLRLVIDNQSRIDESYILGNVQAADFTKSDSYQFIATKAGVGVPVDYPVSIPLNLKVSGLDSQVEAIRESDIDADIKLTVSAPSGVGFTVCDGYTFTLPEFMYVTASSLPSFAELVSNGERRNIIRIKGNQTSHPFTLDAKVDRLDLSSFPVSKGGLDISGNATASGKVIFSSLSLAEGTKFSLTSTASVTSVKVKTVEAKVSPTIGTDDRTISLGTLPDALTDGSLNFEFDDISLYLTATNTTPFDLLLSASITASAGGTATSGVSLGKDNALIFKAESNEKSYCISDSGNLGSQTDVKISVPGLAKLLSPIPDQLKISGMKVYGSTTSQDGYVKLCTSEPYRLSLDYKIDSPLIFKSLALIRDENVKLDFDLGDASLSDLFIFADVENKLPLEARLSCRLLDSDGNPMKGISVTSVDAEGNETEYLAVSAGDVSTPSAAKLHLKVTASDGQKINKLSSLSVHIEASSPAGRTVTLNANQGISISGIVVGTENGIHIEGGNDGDTEWK